MKYLVLGEIWFDWSYGEYGNDCVDDVYLGQANTKEEAQILFDTYCDDTNRVVKSSSEFELREII